MTLLSVLLWVGADGEDFFTPEEEFHFTMALGYIALGILIFLSLPFLYLWRNQGNGFFKVLFQNVSIFLICWALPVPLFLIIWKVAYFPYAFYVCFGIGMLVFCFFRNRLISKWFK